MRPQHDRGAVRSLALSGPAFEPHDSQDILGTHPKITRIRELQRHAERHERTAGRHRARIAVLMAELVDEGATKSGIGRAVERSKQRIGQIVPLAKRRARS